MGRNPKHHSNLNKGAWSAAEDQILIDFVSKYGEGKWERVLKHTNLRRCGKSCRLRWLNYLQPDIKRGNISEDEEELIVRLHKLLGNRWSLIARRLPGRTDNEIKNYWNSTLRKKLQLGSEQPKIPIPRKSIAMKAAPPVAIEGHPSDQTLAASAVNPEGSLASRKTIKAEDQTMSPVASEKDGCPWDSMVDHGLVETCFPEFLDPYRLDVGGACTPAGPGQCDNRFDQPCVVSSWENLEDGGLYEEMLQKWAAELINS